MNYSLVREEEQGAASAPSLGGDGGSGGGGGTSGGAGPLSAGMPGGSGLGAFAALPPGLDAEVANTCPICLDVMDRKSVGEGKGGGGGRGGEESEGRGGEEMEGRERGGGYLYGRSSTLPITLYAPSPSHAGHGVRSLFLHRLHP